MPAMIKRSGGVIGSEYRIVESNSGKFLVIELHIKVVDAMGANCVNHACEVAKIFISEKMGYEPLMGILTNLANKRIVHAQAKWPSKLLKTDVFSGERVAERIIDFLYGAIYAIDGKIQKLGGGIFLCTPRNVNVEGNISDDSAANTANTKNNRGKKEDDDEDFF
jgi:hydroxymethylglutaryl-CoA reductase